ncbi:MAG: tetraacyldisaccharide 4'-kinase [Candidatus Rokuibacteriota bacterium]|nr:MAG: tetraacyldisaccharide 4'-kinase [Candidatus Rokubacteria bacterium]
MSLGRSIGRARLLQGWESGFSPTGAAVLGAVSGGYRRLLDVREWLYARGVVRSRAVGCPVVSVGNLTLGGTGKTPATLLAVETLVGLGHRPGVVSRGYGRRTGSVQVVADTASIRLDAEDAGDEPFLLARRLPGVPVVVGPNRYDAARFTVSRFDATVIVLDDAFQHRTLVKDLEIVMVRAVNPWGNRRLLPGGPLREPLVALKRAHLVIATGAANVGAAEEVARTVREYAPGVPVIAAAYAPTECWEAARMSPVKPEELVGARLLGFAGIGTPGAFRKTLADLGVVATSFVEFDDHHWYTSRELQTLAERASGVRADGLVTTEKDWVRFRTLPLPAMPVFVIGVKLEVTAGEAEWRAAFEGLCRTR